MPVSVRNLVRTLTVFSDIPTKTAVEWGPAGDPSGNDIQQVPDALLEHPRFLKAVGIGIFEIIDMNDPVLADAIQRQAAAYARGQVIEKDQIQSLLESNNNGREIVISEDDMARHIASLSKGQGAQLDDTGAVINA